MHSCRLPLFMFAVLSSAGLAAPAPLALPPLTVTATRIPQDAATLPLSVEVISGETLRDAPALTLDDTLRRSAAFSLFRRSGSLTANPTAQGVSLRGIGPSGASRALVLLDGVPVNDPFGGWIAWTKLPVAALDRVEIVRGGGSAAWGGASLGGVIHLISSPLLPPVNNLSSSPESVTNMVTQSAGSVATPARAVPGQRVTNKVTLVPVSARGSATVGDFRTRAAEGTATLITDSGRDAFRLDAATFATDGVPLVRDPGLIDMPADSEYQRVGLTWARRISETTTLTTAARTWREERGNGTPYQRNSGEDLFASVSLAGTPRNGPAWSFTLYAQEQDFRSAFSAVNAARSAEIPASDQYAVPAVAFGSSVQLTWGDASALGAPGADASDAVTTLGLDARHVDGETRERFFFNGTEFTRERHAGGAQSVAGLFATHARPLAPDLVLTTGARLDATRRADGRRLENTIATGAVLFDEAYADRDDLAFSPSLGLAWRTTETLTVRAAVYSAYRTPTLNELYRPFRIGSITTRANPELYSETLLGGELGLAYAAPSGGRGLRTTVFHNELSDAVANVTLDATTRQRRNLDAVRVRGLELGGYWQAAPALRLDGDYLFSDARVRSGGFGAEALDGKRLAQVPRHTVSLGAAWQATRALEFDLRARWFSAQFEDDINTLELASATRIDLAVRFALSARLRFTLAVENLFDAEIETARTNAGLVSIGPPRQARAELGYAW